MSPQMFSALADASRRLKLWQHNPALSSCGAEISTMGKQRLEAFTDGVLAIILTIMVLDMKVPAGSSFSSLRADLPVLLTYALSSTNVGIFWNNHHHMLHATERVNGAVLWANMFLLFWMSLIPFVIRWMNEVHFAATPTAAYGVVLALAGAGYFCWNARSLPATGPIQS